MYLPTKWKDMSHNVFVHKWKDISHNVFVDKWKDMSHNVFVDRRETCVWQTDYKYRGVLNYSNCVTVQLFQLLKKKIYDTTYYESDITYDFF